MLDTFHVHEVSLELEERRTYLHAHLVGEVLSKEVVERVTARLGWWMEKQQIPRLLVDARDLVVPFPDEACHATWEWIHARRFEQCAIIFSPAATDLVMTRMNMTAVSSGLPVRGFAAVVDAHRWLDPRLSGIQRRHSSTTLPALGGLVQSGAGSDPPRRPSGLFSAVAEPAGASVRPKRASDPE